MAVVAYFSYKEDSTQDREYERKSIDHEVFINFNYH